MRGEEGEQLPFVKAVKVEKVVFKIKLCCNVMGQLSLAIDG